MVFILVGYNSLFNVNAMYINNGGCKFNFRYLSFDNSNHLITQAQSSQESLIHSKALFNLKNSLEQAYCSIKMNVTYAETSSTVSAFSQFKELFPKYYNEINSSKICSVFLLYSKPNDRLFAYLSRACLIDSQDLKAYVTSHVFSYDITQSSNSELSSWITNFINYVIFKKDSKPPFVLCDNGTSEKCFGGMCSRKNDHEVKRFYSRKSCESAATLLNSANYKSRFSVSNFRYDLNSKGVPEVSLLISTPNTNLNLTDILFVDTNHEIMPRDLNHCSVKNEGVKKGELVFAVNCTFDYYDRVSGFFNRSAPILMRLVFSLNNSYESGLRSKVAVAYDIPLSAYSLTIIDRFDTSKYRYAPDSHKVKTNPNYVVQSSVSGNQDVATILFDRRRDLNLVQLEFYSKIEFRVNPKIFNVKLFNRKGSDAINEFMKLRGKGIPQSSSNWEKLVNAIKAGSSIIVHGTDSKYNLKKSLFSVYVKEGNKLVPLDDSVYNISVIYNGMTTENKTDFAGKLRTRYFNLLYFLCSISYE